MSSYAKSPLNINKFTTQDVIIDRYIRREVQQLPGNDFVLSPSQVFVKNVMSQVTTLERQRQLKMNVLFGVVAISPFIVREVWFAIRHDFISVAHLPFGDFLTKAYSVFLSSMTAYAFVAGGVLLAVFIVGLPKWRVPFLQHLSRN